MHIHGFSLYLCLAVTTLVFVGCSDAPTEEASGGNAPAFTPRSAPTPGGSPLENPPPKPAPFPTTTEEQPELKAVELKPAGINLPDAELASRFAAADFSLVMVMKPKQVMNSPIIPQATSDGEMDMSKVEQMIAYFGMPPASEEMYTGQVVRFSTAQQCFDEWQRQQASQIERAKLMPGMKFDLNVHEYKSCEYVHISHPFSNTFVLLADPRTLVSASHEEVMKKMIDATRAEPGPLAKRIRAADLDHDAVYLGILPQMQRTVTAALNTGQQTGTIPALVPLMVNGILINLDDVEIAMDISSGDNLVEGILTGKNDQSAQKVLDLLDGLLTMGKKQWDPQRKAMLATAEGKLREPAEDLIEIIDGLLDNLKIERNDSNISIVVGRPANFEKLPEIIKQFEAATPPPEPVSPTPKATDPNITPFHQPGTMPQ